ncbi:MAG: hypothetical protein WCP69_06480 [Bacteroidota bacterium]
MLRRISFCFLFTIIIFHSTLSAQKKIEEIKKGDPEKAMMLIKSGNFYSAIKEFEILVVEEPDNLSYHAFLGFAYLSTNINKTKAIPHFELVTKDSKADPYSNYDLGRAYMLAYRFDDAIKSFEKFRSLVHDKEKDIPVPAKRMIEMCNQAKELYKKRINVRLQNVGPEINSPYPDYSPFIDANETTLFFTSRRSGNIGNFDDIDGLKTADVFISNLVGDTWSKAKRVSSTINSYLIEESVGMSADGTDLFIYIFNEKGMDDIFMSSKKGRNYQRSEFLSINSTFEETSASISPDKNTIFFASKRPGGKGKRDLWMAKKLPTGVWGNAINLGDTINTEHDEDFPQIAPDGKTLYFASTGHYGMGNYDLFKCTWDSKTNTFTKPENLGYPINTPDDNKTISFSKSGRYAYIHDVREGGSGDQDIYKVTFLDFPAPYATYIGYIFNKDSIKIDEFRLREISSASLKLSIIEKEIENTKVKTANLQKLILDLESDTTAVGISKKAQHQKSLAKLEEGLTNLTTNKLPVAQTTLFEASKPLNTVLSLVNPNTGKTIYKYTPNKNSGEFAIIAPPGNYKLVIKGDKYPEKSINFNIPDREPLPEPYRYNIYYK